jgi:hypothetical protein
VSRTQPLQALWVAGDPIDEPERRRGRGDIPEQRLLIAERLDIAQAAPPSASITARSRITRPWSCPDRRCLSSESPDDSVPVNPVLSATPANSALPAWETKPTPSGATTTLKSRPSRCTLKVTS